MIVSVVLIAAIIAMDRLVKFWAMTVLAPVSELPGIKGIFRFYYVENSGAAFSILREHTWILIVITAIVIAAGIYMLFFMRLKWPYRLGLIGIIGGGIGNLLDRILYGYVIDMFMVDFIDFPIFNVADIFITVSGIALIVILFLDKDQAFFAKKPAKVQDLEILDESTAEDSTYDNRQ